MVEGVKGCAKSELAAFKPLPVLQQSHHCGIAACGRVPAGESLRVACGSSCGSACGGLPAAAPAPLACGWASAGKDRPHSQQSSAGVGKFFLRR